MFEIAKFYIIPQNCTFLALQQSNLLVL